MLQQSSSIACHPTVTLLDSARSLERSSSGIGKSTDERLAPLTAGGAFDRVASISLLGAASINISSNDKFALLQSDFATEVFCYSGSLRMIGRIDDGLLFPAIVRRPCNITTGVFGTSNSMASHGLMRRGSFVKRRSRL
jgi:hypothetical protein